MEKKRFINGVILYLITMVIFIGKFNVTKLNMYQSLVIALSSAIIAFGMEHILTLNIIREYDEMKYMNRSGIEPLMIMTKILYVMVTIAYLVDTGIFVDGERISGVFSAQGLLIFVIIIDNISIYVGNKYMYLQNKFIKLEDIANFTIRHIETKRGKETNRVEVIVETKQGKKYKIVLSKLATGNLEELESRFSNNTELA